VITLAMAKQSPLTYPC